MVAGFLLESWSALSWVHAAGNRASSFPPGAISWTWVSADALCDCDFCSLQLPELLGLVICFSNIYFCSTDSGLLYYSG